MHHETPRTAATIATPVPATPAGASAGEASCRAGCPLGTVSPVCGADGITYQTPCLATCSGKTAVQYQGPCLPGGSAAAAAMALNPDPALVPADLASRHPIASLFGEGIVAPKTAGGAPKEVVASLRDMQKYARQGYTLVGVVPTQAADSHDAPKGPRKPTSNPDAERVRDRQ